MRQISEGVYERGKHGNLYVRRRNPVDLRAAYPPKQTHVIRSAGNVASADGKARARRQLVEIDNEFSEKRTKLNLARASETARRVGRLTEEQLQAVARYWVRQVLLTDDEQRRQGARRCRVRRPRGAAGSSAQELRPDARSGQAARGREGLMGPRQTFGHSRA
ncbi:MAG: hypothetical protein JSR54_15370 [Proteobacteria bacterium]|nr:hypothetical protein [Pseudomonadota bacterium]